MTLQAKLATGGESLRVSHRRPASGRTNIKILRVHVPLALFVCASACLVFRNSEGVFLSTSLAGSLGAIYILGVLIFSSPSLKLSSLAASGLLLGYALGSFNTGIRLLYTGVSLGTYTGRSQSDLTEALGYVLLVAAALLAFGAPLEAPISISTQSLSDRDFKSILFAISLVAVAYASGSLGYQGVIPGEDRHVNPIGEIAGQVCPVLMGLTFMVQSKCRNRALRHGSWVLLAAELLCLIPQGRRIALYSVLVGIVGFSLSGGLIGKAKVKKAFILILASVSLYASNRFFFALRYVQWNSGPAKLSLPEQASRASSFVFSGANDNYEILLNGNLQDRTFILVYLSDLVRAAKSHLPLFGGDIEYCVENAIPSVFYDKSAVLSVGMEENLANPQFGLPVQDEANSLLTSGVSDFGLPGLFFYPFAVLSVVSLVSTAISRWLPPIARVAVGLASMFLVVQAEQPLTAYVGFCRDLGLLALIFSVTMAIPKISNASSGRRIRRSTRNIVFQSGPDHSIIGLRERR